MFTDEDGNTRTRPSSIGVVSRAVVQPLTFSEAQEMGFDAKARYRLRLANYPALLGAQAQVEWQGGRYAIEGEPRQYNGSGRTRHVDYVMMRR
ncbi:hypothetical protein [Mycolicibacterium llatzerense]|uniref:phage head completion protein n=1 Tax=Mycolicibacterium llatzerense TaxID=280871 RepID=UPI0013A6D14E|nr:hypothetical protein [Mycolicibacterium llatzerense]